MQRPKVSIVTAVKNGASCLERCIRSVQQQTYSHWEHIVIDACSDDGTVGLLRSRTWENLLWKSEPDSGIYDGMNKGIALASGEIIAILNADDEYLPYALEKAVELLEGNEDCAAYGQVYKNAECSVLALCDSKALLSGHPLLEMPVPHVGLFVPRSWYLKWGGFDLSFRLAADFELLCRWRLHTRNFKPLPNPVAIAHPGGATSKAGVSRVLREFRQISLRYGASWIGVQWYYFSHRVKWILIPYIPKEWLALYLRRKSRNLLQRQ